MPTPAAAARTLTTLVDGLAVQLHALHVLDRDQHDRLALSGAEFVAGPARWHARRLFRTSSARQPLIGTSQRGGAWERCYEGRAVLIHLRRASAQSGDRAKCPRRLSTWTTARVAAAEAPVTATCRLSNAP